MRKPITMPTTNTAAAAPKYRFQFMILRSLGTHYIHGSGMVSIARTKEPRSSAYPQASVESHQEVYRRRLCAELPQQRGDLAAVIGLVIGQVKQGATERI